MLIVLLSLFVAALAFAAAVDARGWSAGTPAMGTSRVLRPPPEDAPVALPRWFSKTLTGQTLLVYFSPNCPHCQKAAPELNALSQRMGDRAAIVGIGSGSATQQELDQFVRDYRVPYRVIYDKDGDLGAAMGVKSTPSALLVAPDKKRWKAVEGWYPYLRGYDVLVEMRVAEQPWSAFRPGEYHGVRPCAVCHVQEAESWTLTHHSVAWRTLATRDHTEDAACTGCHVTGAGKEGGWDGDAESTLVDVGCEACHGPSGPHDGEPTDAKETCIACHDAEHSIAFSYEKGLPLIDHFKAAAMDDPSYQKARKALLNGEAPRDLLAFREGGHVGSAACASCHKAESAAWQASPHAAAMGSLKEKGSEDPSCVRCHASAKRSGPPPVDMAGYAVQEGVGCESCHGPGEAHVAAGGGTGNIEALGKDCPVCVLEAVCTSCHTKQWDPDWKLDPSLEAVRRYHHAEK